MYRIFELSIWSRASGQNFYTSLRDARKQSLRYFPRNQVRTYSKVSSNWALFFPSTVVAVQLSGQCTVSQLVPKFIIWEKRERSKWQVTSVKTTHWLYRENLQSFISYDTRIFTSSRTFYHSRFHCADSLILCIMWYVWRAMEEIIYSMSCVCSHSSAVVCTRNRLADYRAVNPVRLRR